MCKFIIWTTAALFAAAAHAQRGQQRPEAPLKVTPLSGGVYWTSGGAGGNTGFIVGTNGVIVIDAKMTANSAKELLQEIAKVTPKPVTHVILTHSDADHVNFQDVDEVRYGVAALVAGKRIRELPIRKQKLV